MVSIQTADHAVVSAKKSADESVQHAAQSGLGYDLLLCLHRVSNLNSFSLRLLIVFLISCGFSADNAALAAPSATGWLLSQKHTANGRQLVYVFPEKLRVENVKMGYTLVADAPSGKVWIFNDQRRIMCCVPWDKFEHSFSKMMEIGGENISKLKWAKAKDPKNTVSSGLKTHCFKATDEKLYFKGGGGGFVSGGSRMVKVDYTIYVAEKITTSPKLLKVLAEMQTSPVLDGVPLREESFFNDYRKQRVFLETQEAKQIPDDKKLWDIPKYRQVRTVTEVTNMTDQTFIEDILGKPDANRGIGP